ncbi:MAG: hypothetical protein U9R69_05475, partial [Thermodesulfobacteriota bacterium]|nr:hypothetical protein [Thermodesulfobacteriota bacterium]
MRPRLALSVLLLLCFMPVQLFAVDMNLIIVIDPIVRPDFGEIQIPDYDFTMQDCSATVVTENSTYDTDPSLHNGQLAWSGEDPNTGTRQIFLWNVDDPVGTASMVTSASIDGRYPSLYNGQIAYKSTDSWFNGNISMYDGTQNSSVTTGEDTWAISPSLYHNGLAYSRYEDGDFEIYYQAGLSTQQITDNTTNDSSPSLYNGTIAWMGHDGSDYEIYYWDGSTVHQITNNSYDDTYPSLYAGTIAWQGQNSTTSEIFYWNGSTILQITNDN